MFQKSGKKRERGFLASADMTGKSSGPMGQGRIVNRKRECGRKKTFWGYRESVRERRGRGGDFNEKP